MNRTLAFVALALVLTGCTRHGTRMNGPFARQRKLDPAAPIPPGPSPNNSPLALAADTQPEPPRPPDENRLVPSRPPADVLPAGGVPPDDGAFPPIRRRKSEPQPNQLPSPLAPKTQGETPPEPAPKAQDPAPGPVRHIAEVKKLVGAAADKWAKVDTYEAIVTRRELSPKGKMTEDVVLYQFRKEPMSVYIRNVGESGKGRELLYSPAKLGDKIHAVVGQGDENFLFKVGQKAPPVSPDMPLVKEKTRYSIREAGWGTPIARVGTWAAKVEAGKIPADALTYHGPVERKEYPYPLLGVQLKLRPGDDPLLPSGGVRQWFFDPKPDSPTAAFPVLIVATEPDGREVEYYLFEKVKFGVPLTDADFSPDRLGKKR